MNQFLLENKNENWEKIHQIFLDKKIDILPLAKTEKILNSFNFTNKIDYIPTYKINKLTSKSKFVGIIKDTIEENLIKKYNIDNDLKIYPNKRELKKALNKMNPIEWTRKKSESIL